MEAYAEGFELLKAKEAFALDPANIAKIWNHGSVIRSWLLELTTSALDEAPALETVRSFVEDSGEGRWTVKESVDLGVPMPVITLALQLRFRPRQDQPFAGRLLAAMRKKFGGHSIREIGH
jgi:6-phosphogluconate dehydrogenase